MSAPSGRRAVVTGLGVVSCIGRDPESFWEGMCRARMLPEPYPDPNAHMPYPLLYRVPGDPDGAPDGSRFVDRPIGRASAFALEAGAQALADAELPELDPDAVAVVLGTGQGDAGLHERWRVDDSGGATRWAPEFAAAAAVGEMAGAAGANACISNACASSAFAMSIAADLIETGEADVVVTGGTEGYSRVALGCFNRLAAVDAERCRPFDRMRAGTVFGEGAAIFVLEEQSHARARGAPRVYARFAGAGWSCDAHHLTAPEPDGEQIVRALRAALGTGRGEPPEAPGCVVPHGTGTELNDVVEARAMTELFGPRCGEVPMYSLKGLIGHTAGAAGAFAALAGTLILDRREIPPNVPIGELDPDCEMLLSERSLPLGRQRVLMNTYAFGGNNVSLALEAPDA